MLQRLPQPAGVSHALCDLACSMLLFSSPPPDRQPLIVWPAPTPGLRLRLPAGAALAPLAGIARAMPGRTLQGIVASTEHTNLIIFSQLCALGMPHNGVAWVIQV